MKYLDKCEVLLIFTSTWPVMEGGQGLKQGSKFPQMPEEGVEQRCLGAKRDPCAGVLDVLTKRSLVIAPTLPAAAPVNERLLREGVPRPDTSRASTLLRNALSLINITGPHSD